MVISATEGDIIIWVNDMHPLKAVLPIEVTEFSLIPFCPDILKYHAASTLLIAAPQHQL